MDYQKWFDIALQVIEKDLTLGRKFEVKQLFPAHEWERLPVGERKEFGRIFARAVRENRVPHVCRIENGKARHNRYMKVIAENIDEDI